MRRDTRRLVTCGYIPHAHGAFEYLIDQARYHLSRRKFDTMVGTGMSGALVIPRLADALDVDFVLVRKPSENSHSSQLAEGWLGKRWIFVDDFVSSGVTYRRIARVMRELAVNEQTALEFGGIYQYRGAGKFQPRSVLRDERFEMDPP